MGEDGIFHVDFGPCTRITRDHALKIISDGMSLPTGRKYCVLSHAPYIMQVDEAAKPILFSRELGSITAACAILLHAEGLNENAGELFLFFDTPPYPIELFSKKNEAITWLNTHLQENFIVAQAAQPRWLGKCWLQWLRLTTWLRSIFSGKH